jgi:sulfopyruvate decarboxylase TPP-binding subunit
MLGPNDIVSALEAAGFTHLVWIPDSHLGTWESALRGSRLAPIRVCREGEAIGVAIGLLLGGARPLVAVQCTGFFEAGDAIRNAVHDLKLPLKLLIGVRSERAVRAGKSQDNCPKFAEKLVAAWELPYTRFDPTKDTTTELAGALKSLADQPTPTALLWAE